MESYILRIYRQGEADEGQLLGTVEDMLTEGQLSFRNFEELRDILHRRDEKGCRRWRVVGRADAGEASAPPDALVNRRHAGKKIMKKSS